MFRCAIKTGGAAFCNPETGEEDELAEGYEVARILEKIAKEIRQGKQSGVVMDLNGNKVGSWGR